MNRRQEGFSLAEIIVGLGIGMISMVVIMQVFAVFEGGKRTTTSGVDAQNNGALALYMIEQDARMAGWGMEPATYANCNNVYSYCDGSATCDGAAGAISGLTFAPLTLEDGGNEPDSFSSKYFANPKFTGFQLTSRTKLQRTMPQSSSELDVGSVNGCRDGDLMIVSQAGNCTLMQITHIQTTAGKIQHNPGASGPYNPPASYQNANGWPAYTVGAEVSCFPAPDKGALHLFGQHGYQATGADGAGQNRSCCVRNHGPSDPVRYRSCRWKPGGQRMGGRRRDVVESYPR